MPVILGTETFEFKKVRSIDAFTVSIRPGGDMLDVSPVLERRNVSDNALIETLPMLGGRFSEEEIRAMIGNVSELPDYDTLRLGLAKLMHALLNTR